MRQIVSEYMKKIGIEDDQTSMPKKIMMDVNEMEISKESSEKLKNYSDKHRSTKRSC